MASASEQSSIFDLRSDTVTRPTAGMREAMMAAELGDDAYREDPTVNRLEAEVASLLGKEQALFVPSGTMANQIALLLHVERGNLVVTGARSHCMMFEAGAGAAWAGAGFVVAGANGLFEADDLEAVLPPPSELSPIARLVWIENTHNTAGGRVFPQANVERIAGLARERGLRLHLDGARLWNACAATGRSPAELSRPFDTVSVCFSKGLGAPVGSAIVGTRELMDRARRFRRMLGGALRQAGILAAAALYGLGHHRARLTEDHENAAALAAYLREVPAVRIEPVETNIVLVRLPEHDARAIVERARTLGLLCNATDRHALRLVTHLDFPGNAVESAAALLRQAIGVDNGR